jgi:hypothetical protein
MMGGVGMSERMNEEEARATLLEVLQERLEEHRRDAAERDPREDDTLERVPQPSRLAPTMAKP